MAAMAVHGSAHARAPEADQDSSDEDVACDAVITPALVEELNGPVEGERTMLQLSWAHIGCMENLSPFQGVRTLYLQHNRISKIEGLQELRNLEFLALHHNAIRRVEGVATLERLQFLDLSDNQIRDVNCDALPVALVILRLQGNPTMEDYRAACQFACPQLEELDDAPVGGATPAVAEKRADAEAGDMGDTGNDTAEEFVSTYMHRNDRTAQLSQEIAQKVAAFAALAEGGEGGLSGKVRELAQRSVDRRQEDTHAGPSAPLLEARAALQASLDAQVAAGLEAHGLKNRGSSQGAAVSLAGAAVNLEALDD